MNRLRFYVNKGAKLCYNCTVAASKRNAQLLLALNTPYLHGKLPSIRFRNTIFLIHALLPCTFSKLFLQNSVMLFIFLSVLTPRQSDIFRLVTIKLYFFIVNICCVIMTLYLPYHCYFSVSYYLLLLPKYDPT
jgi:hypothetical protein